MTLDEIEKLARDMVDYFNESRSVSVNINTGHSLAQHVLALLPIVRLALEVVPDDIEDGPDWDDENWLKLGDAIDTMRAALARETK